MVTKSLDVLSSRSNCVALTLTTGFSLNRRAVDFIIAKASGSISFRTSSIFSSTAFTSLSASSARADLRSTGISCSSSSFILAILSSSSAILLRIRALRESHFSLSWSLESLSISEYAARTLSSIGLSCFKSLSALVPKIFLKTSVSDIFYLVRLYKFGLSAHISTDNPQI